MSADPLAPAGFDCSRIQELGIDKQTNFRAGAIMIAGEAHGGVVASSGGFSKTIQELIPALAFGAGDVNVITGTETSPNITQSTTFTTANPDNPDQIVVALQRLTWPQRQSHQHLWRIGLHRRRRELHPTDQSQRPKPL